MQLGTKTCKRCSEIKLLTQFYAAKTSKDRKQSTCKQCDKTANAIWQKMNAEKCKFKSAKWKYQNKYSPCNIAPEERQKLFDQQQGKCAICGVHQTTLNKNLAVDHDHKTNKIRGLLCMKCNTGLGMFKDDTQVLQAAITYLFNHFTQV